jgi:hypothetical protein
MNSGRLFHCKNWRQAIIILELEKNEKIDKDYNIRELILE